MGDLKILSYVRVICGINLLVFQFFVIAPYFTEIYSTDSFFSSALSTQLSDSYFSFSVLFYFNTIARLLCFIIWVLCSFALIFGASSWVFWILIIFLNSQFHNLNPLIVHEPQQILNFLILVMPFLNCTKFNLFELLDLRKEKTDDAPLEIGLLTFFLGFYYFLAGVKKIPLKSWQYGDGFQEILSWNGIAGPWLEDLEPMFNNFFIDLSLNAMNYSILIFEISFLFLAFTRAKRYLIPIGLLFQILNFALFDVGLFFLIMLSLYPVLLSQLGFFGFLKSLKDTFFLVKDDRMRF